MMRPYLFGILVLLACSCLEVTSRPSNNEFYDGRGWRGGGHWSRSMKQSDQYIYDGMNFREAPLKLEDTTFMLFIKPIAHALNSQGTALANPISHVVIARNQSGTIFHAPLATAVAGPGGVAHAQSDLYLYEFVDQ